MRNRNLKLPMVLVLATAALVAGWNAGQARATTGYTETRDTRLESSKLVKPSSGEPDTPGVHGSGAPTKASCRGGGFAGDRPAAVGRMWMMLFLDRYFGR